MTCNLLGSLWTQFCESCNCAFGKFCDCSSKNIIIIAQPNSKEALAAIQQIIESSNTDLEKAISVIQNPDWKTSKLSLQTKDEEIEHKDEISLAILDVAFRCLEEVTDTPIINRQEKWHRLLTAGHLSLIDLEEKFKKSDPMTLEEFQELHKKVKFVRRYGSRAAYLWDLLKKEPDLQKLYKERKITRKQLEMFLSLFRRFSKQELFSEKSFMTVPVAIRAEFLKVAEQSHKSAFEKRNKRHVSWMGDRLMAQEFDDYKVPEINLHWIEFFQELKELDEALSGKKGEYLSRLRLEVLCMLSGINPQRVVEEILTDEEIRNLKKLLPEMRSLDGVIVYLFKAIQETHQPEELEKVHHLNIEVISQLKTEVKLHPYLIGHLKSAKEVGDLTATDIALLFRLARVVTSDKKQTFQELYTVADWIALRLEEPVMASSCVLEIGSENGNSDSSGRLTPSVSGSPVDAKRALSRDLSDGERKIPDPATS